VENAVEIVKLSNKMLDIIQSKYIQVCDCTNNDRDYGFDCGDDSKFNNIFAFKMEFAFTRFTYRN
jgi:hypothetical protein